MNKPYLMMKRDGTISIKIMKKNIILLLFIIGVSSGYLLARSGENPLTNTDLNNYPTATFAGGCFWCMQPPYDNTPGVIATRVGYLNGHIKNPTYEQVCTGTTGHTEAIEVVYDPTKVSYEELLTVFWQNINPTQENGQFADKGSQYRTGIYYHSDAQKKAAENSKKELGTSGRFDSQIVTEIEKADTFYIAEDNHQKYYEKNVLQYNFYKVGSGRDAYLKKTWENKRK